MDIKQLAEYYVCRFASEWMGISHAKLQKLLYYTQAWHITLFEKNMLFNELPEAWVNGPVYRSVYENYKGYPMYTPINIYDGNDMEATQKEVKDRYDSLDISETQKDFIESVFKKYGFKNTDELILLTHLEKPWNDARQGYKTLDICTEHISVESMFNYYSARGKKKTDG